MIEQEASVAVTVTVGVLDAEFKPITGSNFSSEAVARI